MTNQELYKQALLDAKAVRETALAHAKASLSEAFEPRIKEMMRLKLSEELEEGEDQMEESMDTMQDEARTNDESGMMDEATLDEILAELDALSEEMKNEADTMDEGHIKSDGYTGGKGSAGKDAGYKKAGTSTGDHKLHEADKEEGDEDKEEGDDDESSKAPEAPETGGEEATDDETVVDITVGELKDIIRDVFMQLQGGGDMGAEMEPATDEENAPLDMPMGGGEMDEISLDEILAELEKESSMEEALNPGAESTHKGTPGAYKDASTEIEEARKKEEKMKKDLEEANKAVAAMRGELNEINLLNAKLLYFNKILKAKNLNESQKVKVMNAFDRAMNVKEVENTYKTLSESLEGSKKTNLKESIGFASKPIGNAPAKPIVEADAYVSRWQTLAGIKPNH